MIKTNSTLSWTSRLTRAGLVGSLLLAVPPAAWSQSNLANDTWQQAIHVTSESRHFFTNFGANTDGPTRGNPVARSMQADVWFRFTNEGERYVTIELDTDFITFIEVFACAQPHASCPPTSDSVVAYGNGSSLQFSSLAGSHYLVRIGGNPDMDGEGTGFLVISTNDWRQRQGLQPKTCVPLTMRGPMDRSVLNLTGNIRFSWSSDCQDCVLERHLYVGSAPFRYDYFSNRVFGESQLVTGLPTDGSYIWVTLWSKVNDRELRSPDGTIVRSTRWTYNTYRYRAAAHEGYAVP